MDLPKPIACYFEAQNHQDPDAAILCFTNDATVFDEGKTMIGTMAIREWNLQGDKIASLLIRP